KLLPEDEGGLLKQIVGVVEVAHQGMNVAVQPRLLLAQILSKLRRDLCAFQNHRLPLGHGMALASGNSRPTFPCCNARFCTYNRPAAHERLSYRGCPVAVSRKGPQVRSPCRHPSPATFGLIQRTVPPTAWVGANSHDLSPKETTAMSVTWQGVYPAA